MDYSAIIDRLEKEIRQYRVEFQRFFNGDVQVPPEDSSTKIRQRLNQLTAVAQLSQVDRFRLSGLEARYNSLSELHRRRLREMDIQHHITAPAPQPSPRPSTSAVVGEAAEADDVDTLFTALYSKASPTIAREDFHAYLLDQAAKLRQQTGCKKVRFTVRTDGDKKRLKARPLPAQDTR